MLEQEQKQDNQDIQADRERCKILLDLWKGENPIKTTKLQVLLIVNSILVSAITASGGFTGDKWIIYIAGAIFCLIWTFSIGRTSLFQDTWQIKIKELHDQYPNDPFFAILETSEQVKKKVRWWVRLFGIMPSRWYLLFSPFIFAIVWLVILIVTTQK